MSKWIAEFDLEDGDTMPEHMDLEYMGARLDFHCRPMWIPVSERLPEKNGEYLITGRQGAVNKRRYHDGHWYGNWSVLAWMPLPEPYRESEDKE